MIKFFIISILIFQINLISADEDLLYKIRTAFQKNYDYEEGAFDDTASKVSYSKGQFIFLNNSYIIKVDEPLSEEYILTKNGLEIIDHEFNQTDFFPLDEIQNPFVAILLSDQKSFQEAQVEINQNIYTIRHEDFLNPIEVTLLDDRVILLRYLDQMSITHIINFSSS